MVETEGMVRIVMYGVIAGSNNKKIENGIIEKSIKMLSKMRVFMKVDMRKVIGWSGEGGRERWKSKLMQKIKTLTLEYQEH